MDLFSTKLRFLNLSSQGIWYHSLKPKIFLCVRPLNFLGNRITYCSSSRLWCILALHRNIKRKIMIILSLHVLQFLFFVVVVVVKYAATVKLQNSLIQNAIA